MIGRIVLVLVGLGVALAVVFTTALATPATPAPGIVVVTARGELDDSLNVNTKFENDARVRLKTQGAIELITQRIEALPGSTFGWHSHPGENVNVILQGTLTLYHDEHCTQGIAYGPGTAFPTHPDGVHLARNNSATETLVLFATYFAPKTTPPLPVRLDAPLPASGCPE